MLTRKIQVKDEDKRVKDKAKPDLPLTNIEKKTINMSETMKKYGQHLKK